MAAMRIEGSIDYEPRIVAASVLIAIAAATVALWLSVAVRGNGPVLTSAAVMGVAVCGMHYTAMYAVHVHLTGADAPVPGIEPLALLLPIVVVTMAALIGLVFSALQTATSEDFSAPDRRYLYRAAPLHRYSGKATVPRSPSVASHR
jgi:NO-binding membrane sensor protein with MHYT domain